MHSSPRRWSLISRPPLFHLLLAGGGLGLSTSQSAQAQSIPGFEASFMHQAPGHDHQTGALALDSLASQRTLAPGSYPVEVLVNGDSLGQHQVDFSASPRGGLQPCLDAELVGQLGIRPDSLEQPGQLLDECVDLPAVVKGAQVDFDGSRLQLAISIPQFYLRRDASAGLSQDDWNHGINAAFLNYQVAAQEGRNRFAGATSSQDLNLGTGLNLGPWRLRSNQSLRQDEDGKRRWTSAYTYLQRDLPGTHANLTLGETFTNGDVFRSVPISGALVASDLGMLSDRQQGYAPIVRGVAYTRARLEIRQNGYPIYTTYVSPGPYQIDDLGTVGGSGELEIILTEADGQVRRFTQPYSTLGNLLRNGVWRYSLAAGRYNASSRLDDPLLWQGTLAVGGAWDSTLYGGLMGSTFYRAGNLGLARDLGALGAVSFDLTRSESQNDTSTGRQTSGMSYAMKYGKSFATRTHLRFAGYRYSTEGYRDFDEAVSERSRHRSFHGSRRSRLEAAIYQNIGSRSAINLTLSQQDYWNSAYEQRQFQFNFNTQYKGVSYNLYASQSLSDERYGNDRQIGLSITLPLEFGRSTNATFDVLENGGRYSQRASLNGSLADTRVSYRASLANDEQQRQSAAIALGYQAPYASLGAGLTQGNDFRSLSFNASGAVLAHGDGLTFGPYLGETMALVEVPDTANVGLLNSNEVLTNARGFALMPYLRPYRTNRIALETDLLGPEVEIVNGTTQVVPRRGAVIKARFEVRNVNRLLLTLHDAHDQPLPFGTQVRGADGEILGLVAQAGQVMLSTELASQVLDIRWGNNSLDQCRLPIDTRHMTASQGYHLQSLTCQ
ncbi:fimbrial biogenesis outer membrane usher protein [Pseudomonas sp. GD04058]|uniref:fimbria/pilus outer membrane usher protein n=1 Tax=Pseudomonas sp. GD04058 TaxID=2975429 RepID=UPI00244C61A8|nr:fimbrial biogenesis outer membrane usher protein [Pseudomonas sp. GD04058]MDG9885526.1 fimbrial biogenesis outer membrane usher protein [Pseudomonas sp. GD04058]